MTMSNLCPFCNQCVHCAHPYTSCPELVKETLGGETSCPLFLEGVEAEFYNSSQHFYD